MNIDAPKMRYVHELKALWQEAFGDTDEFWNMFEQTAFSPDRCRCVTVGNKVVSALYWFECSYCGHRIAYLYAIATAKAHRGQGFCAALMEDTHRHLRELGYDGAVLVPSSESLFGFYERLGYYVCSRISEISCLASTDTLTLRQVGINEYALLRRKFLPKNGIIQENENLRFLQAQATLYTGDSFLLAAQRENDTLYGIELLGDTHVAPDIVRTLGCDKGNFRTHGDRTPFAMYHSFGELRLTPNSYFGLAFD